jgi:hypothetical protein
MPWGRQDHSAPKLLTSFPEALNSRMGSSDEFAAQPLFAPHLSAIQIDCPSLSVSIALIAPHVLPAGCLK